jgi:hypothetical protein
MAEDRLDQLRAQAAYARQRRDLYHAKMFGSRPTDPQRMRELDRELEQADERLAAALARDADD